MFLGTYEPKLGDKGHLILPSHFHNQLSAGVVLTPGQERCIYTFPTSKFETIYDELHQVPLTHKKARKFSRVILSGITDQIPDKQGRVSIPANLRQYAGLNRNLKVIGAGARAEIWDADTWDTYLSEGEDAFAEITEEVMPGLLWDKAVRAARYPLEFWICFPVGRPQWRTWRIWPLKPRWILKLIVLWMAPHESWIRTTASFRNR